MLVLEGTFENGQLHLDTPVTYERPVRVRVEFLDDLSAAIRLPIVSDPAERLQRLQASWAASQALASASTGPTLSEVVVANRQEETY